MEQVWKMSSLRFFLLLVTVLCIVRRYLPEALRKERVYLCLWSKEIVHSYIEGILVKIITAVVAKASGGWSHSIQSASAAMTTGSPSSQSIA